MADLDGRVVVVGSLNVDRVVEVKALPAVGATVAATGHRTGAGGKGLNQAVAAARLGAQVAMVGAVGDDPQGDSLLEVLRDEGVEVGAVAVDRRAATGSAVVTVDAAGANTIVVVAGANASVTPPAAVTAIIDHAPQVVLTQLETPLATVRAALGTAGRIGAVAILNPAPASGPLPPEVLSATSIIVPNEHEVARLTGVADPATAAAVLLERGCRTVVVTLGEAGALLTDERGTIAVPAFPVEPVDTTAAGDAFCGALAAALSRGVPLRDAVRWSCAAGALATTRPGAVASLPGPAEVAALAS